MLADVLRHCHAGHLSELRSPKQSLHGPVKRLEIANYWTVLAWTGSTPAVRGRPRLVRHMVGGSSWGRSFRRPVGSPHFVSMLRLRGRFPTTKLLSPGKVVARGRLTFRMTEECNMLLVRARNHSRAQSSQGKTQGASTHSQASMASTCRRPKLLESVLQAEAVSAALPTQVSCCYTAKAPSIRQYQTFRQRLSRRHLSLGALFRGKAGPTSLARM